VPALPITMSGSGGMDRNVSRVSSVHLPPNMVDGPRVGWLPAGMRIVAPAVLVETHPRNAAAIRVAERAGLTRQPTRGDDEYAVLLLGEVQRMARAAKPPGRNGKR